MLGGRYRVIDRIGAGGMAEVFRAHDQLLARDVAVKVFRTHSDPDDVTGGVQRQELELQTLARLSHPNLITLFDGSIGSAGEPAFLVMELINGPSLAAQIAQAPLTEPQAREIATQIAGALAYVHSQHMVHRDIKPANILLGTDGTTGDTTVRARLSDFGIVRLLGSEHLTSADFMVGTASYLAPEQARGAEVGPAADVYALGLVLIEALTGRRSYEGPALEAVLARLDRSPEIPAGLPQPWPELLQAMTVMDPQLRPSAAEVARTLREGVAVPVPMPAGEGVPGGGAVLAGDAVLAGGAPLAAASGLTGTAALPAGAGVAGGPAGAGVAGAGLAGAAVAGAAVTGGALAGAAFAPGGPADATMAGPALGAPALGAPAVGAPALGAPAAANLAAGPLAGTAMAGTPGAGMPMAGAPVAGSPMAGAPAAGMPLAAPAPYGDTAFPPSGGLPSAAFTGAGSPAGPAVDPDLATAFIPSGLPPMPPPADERPAAPQDPEPRRAGGRGALIGAGVAAAALITALTAGGLMLTNQPSTKNPSVLPGQAVSSGPSQPASAKPTTTSPTSLAPIGAVPSSAAGASSVGASRSRSSAPSKSSTPSKTSAAPSSSSAARSSSAAPSSSSSAAPSTSASSASGTPSTSTSAAGSTSGPSGSASTTSAAPAGASSPGKGTPHNTGKKSG